MNKTFKKVINLVFLALFVSSSAFAINSEFKNTLTNVDLIKTSENSYTVNLYTSKKYSSPIKVIKKSDLSYYILLPETKNITPKITAMSSDIRNVSTTLYPYAGVDVNNGYTKIDITTTKPINFSAVAKSATQETANASTLASNTQTEKTVKKEVQNIQKPTVTLAKAGNEVKKEQKPVTKTVSDVNNQKVSSSASSAAVKKNLSENTAKIAQDKTVQNKTIQNKTSQAKVVQNKTLKDKITKENSTKDKVVNKKTDLKNTDKKAETKQTKAAKTTTAQAKPKAIKQVAKKDTKPVINKKIEDKLAKITTKQQVAKTNDTTKPEINAMAAAKIDSQEDQIDNDVLSEVDQDILANAIKNEKVTLADEVLSVDEAMPVTSDIEQNELENTDTSKKVDLSGFFSNIGAGISSAFLAIKSGMTNGYSNMSDKLSEYGLSVLDLLFMLFAGIFTFVAVIFILSRKQNQPKLKNKSELVDKKESSLVAKKEDDESSKDKNDGQYFVFKDNIKQTGLTSPIDSKETKNFELVSYDPDIRTSSSETKQNENEDLDIIQKVLNDEDSVEVKPVSDVVMPTASTETVEEKVMLKDKVEQTQTTKETIKQNESVTSPIGLEHVQHVQKEELIQNQTSDEPQLLASYNISPEYGFMFISYNNNVNLMGFIYDDVFALYNYKVSELPNYNLQFRLVDTDDKESVYIVKTEKAKLLVKVSRTSMNTEIIL